MLPSGCLRALQILPRQRPAADRAQQQAAAEAATGVPQGPGGPSADGEARAMQAATARAGGKPGAKDEL